MKSTSLARRRRKLEMNSTRVNKKLRTPLKVMKTLKHQRNPSGTPKSVSSNSTKTIHRLKFHPRLLMTLIQTGPWKKRIEQPLWKLIGLQKKDEANALLIIES
jgi:hypothetical protein